MKPLIPIRILLAEDSRGMRALIRESFPKTLYRPEFVEAEDGEEAVALYRKRRCDIVLLDLNMPKLNGFDVLQALRRYDEDVFAVMVSADENPQRRTEAMGLGAADFVTKPITHEGLNRIVNGYRLREKRPVSVLAVDDSQTMLMMLKRGLEIMGIPHRMMPVRDGQEALSVFGQLYFDLVFLDIHLPGVNGLDVLGEMKHRRRDAYVVMVSGDGSPASVRHAKAQGADDYLLKPIDPALFKKTWSRFKVVGGQEFL